MIPFRTGMLVTGKDFCPRKQELEHLRELIGSAGRVYVVGESRIGKTSLIAEAVRLTNKIRPVFVDLMAVKDIEDVTHRLGEALIREEKNQRKMMSLLKGLGALRPSLSFDSLTGSPTVTFAPGSGTRIETLNDLFDAISNLNRPVIVFDEYQDLLDLRDAHRIIAKLRSLIQQQQNTAFIFCGSIRNRMEEIFTEENSPFFNAAVRLQVGPLEQNLFRSFLRKRFLQGERTLSDELLDSIMDACHQNPGHTQRFCISLWQATSRGTVISEKDIVTAWSLLFAMQKDSYELILTTLSPQQARVLRALAHAGGTSTLSSEFIASTGITLAPSVRKAMTKLLDRRLVQKSGTTYLFCDPFLAAWLRQQSI